MKGQPPNIVPAPGPGPIRRRIRTPDPDRLVALPYRAADGASNMALDEAMMDRARGGDACVRFYGWEPPCLSLGRNQPAPERLLGRSRSELAIGVDVVRRPTGGRSVFHGPELTYAFACPDRAWGGPRRVYRRVHRAIGTALGSLGVPLDAGPGQARRDAAEAAGGRARGAGRVAASPLGGGIRQGEALRPDLSACFRDPAPGELTVGGRKLVGSAQGRQGGAILQHGSILLSDRQELGELGYAAGPRDAGPSSEPPSRPGIGLDEVLDELPSPADLAEAVRRALAEELGAALAPGTLPDPPPRAAERYRSPAWQWRA